uniref:NADH-ubiquinone oxidoreductase chain 1 n=1 Tax=Taeniogonalos taihorina TaxID=1515605 RepID=A0A0K0KBJ8_9HYME|nr:NADH dehydrogenase subunit 1 [Taeniogonalos taihorina]AIE11796.1 NADH dehydrogenase subunit 1 [Taeniogonalos taihorina]
MKILIYYYLLNSMTFVTLLVMALIGMSFITLLERKMLSYLQSRKGPNKVSLIGILQPFSDAIKLISKESFFLFKSNYMMFYMSPIITMTLSLTLWLMYPFFFSLMTSKLSILLMFSLMSVSTYSSLLMGWASNSIYSMLGCVRMIAQLISYEVSFFLIFLTFMIISESLSFWLIMNMQKFMWFIFPMFLLGIIFILSMLSELNRTPYDFSEGESELVSGFNTEYFSTSFTMIFMAEYTMIMILSMIFSMMFLMNTVSILFIMKILLISIFIIWSRGLLPRFRYDLLMYMAWKNFLPVSLMFIIISMNMKYLINFF